MRTILLCSMVVAGVVVPAVPVLGQEYVSVQVTEASCDTLHAQVSVFFPFGAGDSCPLLSGFEMLPGDATAFLSLYYDISGPWPDLGCTSTTTIAIPIPSGEVMVHLGTFNIMDGDTSSVVSDTLIQLCATDISEGVDSDKVLWIGSGSLGWEASADHGHGPIRIFSGNGQLVRSCPVASGSCRIDDLRHGMYAAWWPGRGVLRFVRD